MEAGACRSWSGKEGLDEAQKASIIGENKTVIKIMLHLINMEKSKDNL